MRHRGTLVRWDDDKGFGFIAPEDGQRQVFLRHSALRHQLPRPRAGDLLFYELQMDAAKGPRAADALVQPAGQPLPPRRRESGLRLLGVLVPAAVCAAAIASARRDVIPDWVAVVYVASSAATFGTYAVDKYRAIRAQWRISEGTLHLLEMAGGWPGAFAAQRLLRHKNRKWQFQLVFWLIVAAHVAFWSWFTATQRGWLQP